MPQGHRIARIAGIRIALHWTVLLIFTLVVTNLALVTLPAWHPDWSTLLVWATATGAGVLLLASILAHELAHALVGLAVGVRARSITLFVFGGVTDIERDPPTPRAEALMAAVGPLTSLVIGVAAGLAAAGLASASGVSLAAGDALPRLGPVATLLAWVAPVNLVLGVFNLVPGFPLDGGRVLRAAFWRATGDLQLATRWAAAGGRGIAWVLIGTGVVMMFGVAIPFFGQGVGTGIWLALIGWFLYTAASAAYRQVLVRELLSSVPLRPFIRWPAGTLSPEINVAQALDEHVLAGTERAYAVMDEGRLVGMVALAQFQAVPRGDWERTTVREVMIPLERMTVLEAADDLRTAVEVLARGELAQLPVLEAGELRGFVRREDVARWLASRVRPGRGGSPRPRHRDSKGTGDSARL